MHQIDFLARQANLYPAQTVYKQNLLLGGNSGGVTAIFDFEEGLHSGAC